VFKAQGATIVAHAAAAAALRARTPATQGGEREVVPPDVTFAGETHRVSLGGRHVDLFHFGANFDCGMIFMRPDPGTYLFVADLITPGMAWQASDRNSVSALVPSLKRIESLRFDWLLPSHGPTVAHPSAVAERRRYIEAVIAAATDGRRAGLSDDEIVARTTLAEFAALKLAERAREPNLRHVLKSLR
jgi:glyoxylase-like metal-dependent hydrolase (beta-lactamase superfamily II)